MAGDLVVLATTWAFASSGEAARAAAGVGAFTWGLVIS